MAHRSVCCRLNGSGSCVAVAVAVAAAPPPRRPTPPTIWWCVRVCLSQSRCLECRAVVGTRQLQLPPPSSPPLPSLPPLQCNAGPLPRRKQIQKHTHSHMHAPPSPPTLNNHVTRVHDVPHLMIPFTRREACNYHGRGLRPRTVVGGKSRNTTKVYRFFAIFWEI